MASAASAAEQREVALRARVTRAEDAAARAEEAAEERQAAVERELKALRTELAESARQTPFCFAQQRSSTSLLKSSQ